MENGTASPRRTGMRQFAQQCDDRDLAVIRSALRTFIADKQRWCAPPHEELGRALVMLSRSGDVMLPR